MLFQKHKKDIILLCLLIVLAIFTRYYNLGHPENLVSDEGFFVRFARHYLDQSFYHDVHPPLGKFFIAAGIKLFGDNAFGWRFFPALFGTLIIPLAYLLAKKIFKGYFIPFCFSLFIALDGLFLIQSRLARLDIVYVFFIFLTYYLFFNYLESQNWGRANLFLLFSGLSFGLSISTKWFALACIVPILLLFLSQSSWWQKRKIARYIKSNFGRKASLSGLHFFIYLVMIPLGLYLLIWQIHYGLLGFKQITFYENFKIFTYHLKLSGRIHTYGSPFWSWPLLIQPWPYVAEKIGDKVKVIADLGNPLIWWPALVGALHSLKKYWLQNLKLNLLWLIFLAHFLPFIFISRPVFLYHYLPAAPFLWLIFIYLIYDFWQQNKINRTLIIFYLSLIVGSFIFFSPILYGLPLTKEALSLRSWFDSWFSAVK